MERTCASVLAIGLMLLLLIASCAPATPAVGATPAAKAAATAAPPASSGAPTIVPAAATAAPAAAAKIKRGGSLRTARTSDVLSLDPHLSAIGDPVYTHIYDGLTRLDPNLTSGKWDLKPELAESWQQPDPKTLILKLRKGVKFHDGSDFNASVAKWNLDRLSNHPKSMGKTVTASVDSVDVVDEYTIRLNLKGPSASQLVWLSIGPSGSRAGMASKAAVDKMGDDGFGRRGIGTGPFELAEYDGSSREVYKRFEGYWVKGEDGKPLPYLDQILELRRGDAAEMGWWQRNWGQSPVR